MARLAGVLTLRSRMEVWDTGVGGTSVGVGRAEITYARLAHVHPILHSLS